MIRIRYCTIQVMLSKAIKSNINDDSDDDNNNNAKIMLEVLKF